MSSLRLFLVLSVPVLAFLAGALWLTWRNAPSDVPAQVSAQVSAQVPAYGPEDVDDPDAGALLDTEALPPSTPPPTSEGEPLTRIDGTLRAEDLQPVLRVLEPLVMRCLEEHRSQVTSTDGSFGYRLKVSSRDGKVSLSELELLDRQALSPWLDACLADLPEEAPLPAVPAHGHATITRHLPGGMRSPASPQR